MSENTNGTTHHKEVIRDFLFQHSEEAGVTELALITQAKSNLSLRYVHGWVQTYAVAVDDEGNIFERPNSEQKIGRESYCAERLLLVDAEDQKRIVQVIVAVRGQRPDEGKEIDVVSPCGGCREAIAHHNPKARVIIWIGGIYKCYRKIWIGFLLPLQYKEKERPTDGSEISEHKFER